MRALLIGAQPPLHYEFVAEGEYEAVVIGSLTLSQLLRFQDQRVLEALAKGMPVVLYSPGLPDAPGNRALASSLAGAKRELKNWGVVFTDGGMRHVVTAQQAREMVSRGQRPAAGAVLTPLAKEILSNGQLKIDN